MEYISRNVVWRPWSWYQGASRTWKNGLGFALGLDKQSWQFQDLGNYYHIHLTAFFPEQPG